MKTREIITDDLRTSNYLGAVVDVNDPRKEGRIKIRVFGKFDDLDVEDIPWAEPTFTLTGGSSSGSGTFSLPKIGALLHVTFDNGNLYNPMYTYSTKISEELKNGISSDVDYINSHSLLYDSDTKQGSLKIWYTPTNGIKIELGDSVFNIKDDLSIILNADNGKTVHIKKDGISLGQEDKSDEPAVLGNKNEDVLNDLVKKVDEILTMLIKFATTENTTSGSVFILAPLAAGFLTLLQEASSKKIDLARIKTKIPETKSKTISLDK